MLIQSVLTARMLYILTSLLKKYIHLISNRNVIPKEPVITGCFLYMPRLTPRKAILNINLKDGYIPLQAGVVGSFQKKKWIY